jgi:HTH-like domain
MSNHEAGARDLLLPRLPRPAEKVATQERNATPCPEFPRYGYRRITRQLQAERMVINHKAVARLMRDDGLRPFAQVRANHGQRS